MSKQLKQSSKANERLMPLHKQIALGKKPTEPKITNSPGKIKAKSYSANNK